jgi:hypothetical protein
MAAIRGNFAHILDPALRQAYFDRYNEEPQVMPEVFNVLTSDRDSESDSAVSGFGLLQQTNELGALDYEDPVQMYKTTYTHLKYTKGFKVSRELLEDDQHNVIGRAPKLLAKATARTTEYHAAAVLNNAFSTSYTSYGDGKPLASTIHPRADGGTAQSNASSTGITLGETNLETARLALEKVLDDKGQIVRLMSDKLIIPLELRKTAQILMQSTLRPGGANNDVNIYEGSHKVVPWRYLTSTTAWFLQDSGENLLNFFWRVKPEFKSDDSFDADAALFKVRTRFSVGWSDWRGVWGSAGDGAAYSS